MARFRVRGGRFIVAAAVAALLLCGGASGAPIGEPEKTTSAGAPELVGRLPVGIPLRRESESGNAPRESAWWLAGLGVMGAGVLLACAGPLRRRRQQAGVTRGAGTPVWQRILGAGSPTRDVSVLSATRLTPRNSVHVIEWRGRQLLLGCTDQSIVLLAEAPMPPGTDEAGKVSSESAS